MVWRFELGAKTDGRLLDGIAGVALILTWTAWLRQRLILEWGWGGGSEHLEETLQTLRYADKAKQIRNKPVK